MSPAPAPGPAANTTRDREVDHTVRFEHREAAEGAGQSRVGNYGPMTRQHHRIKTHGAWQVKQPFPGIYLWRDPHGVLYLVDHTGTRRVQPSTTRHEPTVELYESLVTLEFAA